MDFIVFIKKSYFTNLSPKQQRFSKKATTHVATVVGCVALPRTPPPPPSLDQRAWTSHAPYVSTQLRNYPCDQRELFFDADYADLSD